MPTILRKNGFEFFFYSNEHLPRHIHVYKAGAAAKFNLEPIVELEETDGMKMKQVNEAFVIVCQHREKLINAWNKYHGQK